MREKAIQERTEKSNHIRSMFTEMEYLLRLRKGILTIMDDGKAGLTPILSDRNLNPQKTKKAPQSGCFFNTPCAPYERKRLLNRMTLIDTGYEWRFFAPFPVKWTQLPL